MSKIMNKARILSSENDASVKQHQETNIEIKLAPNQNRNSPVLYPNVPLMNNQNDLQKHDSNKASENINFTIPEQNMGSQYMQATNRNITDLSNNLEDLSMKNKFLELLVEMYANNPLKINSYVICISTLLMDMLKLLTGCDKVEFVIEDEEPKCCLANTSKLLKIDKILITKDDKTEELKYCYNHVYTEFVKYAISLKYCY